MLLHRCRHSYIYLMAPLGRKTGLISTQQMTMNVLIVGSRAHVPGFAFLAFKEVGNANFLKERGTQTVFLLNAEQERETKIFKAGKQWNSRAKSRNKAYRERASISGLLRQTFVNDLRPFVFF